VASGLRAGLTDYGDPAFSLFLRRAFIKAAGYGDDALDRPIVGITNTASDFNPCHSGVPDLIEAARRGVLLAGGLPMVFPVISIGEAFANPTSMYLRNLMAIDVEEMIRAQPMDSVLLVGGCDKTLPALLMGAASANRPAIVLPTGPMLVGHHGGEVLGACTDCRRLWGEFRAGRMNEAEIDAVNARLAPTRGTCMVMGTASTMACMLEAMGLALPGAATAPATHADRLRLAEGSGSLAVRMARNGAPRPSDLITASSVRNALTVLQAIGGSTNGLIHLTAVAGRLGLPVDLDMFDAIGREVPVLVDLKPTGSHYMEHLHHAGGMPRLLRELAPFLDLSAPTITGGTVEEVMGGAEMVPNQDVIRTADRPVARGGLAVLRGTLAPDGALIKHGAATERLLRHEGRAIVFEDLADMDRRLDDPMLDVDATDVLVLRNAGPVGAAMPEAGYIPIPRKLAALGVKDMVRVSDARMSGTAFGTVVLHVAPEAAVGGPLALVRTGDIVRLDVPGRRLDVLVDPSVLEERRAAWRPPVLAERGYRRLFEMQVTQAPLGCDFKSWGAAPGPAGVGDPRPA
jgi:dihydroxy-acid dehydratase